MTNSQQLATVRQRLLRWLAQQPCDSQQSDVAQIVSESVLIRDGFYCGRRFDVGAYSAVWFMEEDELKIHDSDGELICVFDSQKINQSETSEAPPSQQALTAETVDSTTADVITMPDRDAAELTGTDEDDNEVRRAA